MKRTLLSAVALALSGISAASAQPLILSAGNDYGATVTWNNDGTITYDGVVYDSVLQQDKLYSDFSSGSDLAAGSSVIFSFAHVGADDYHTITFTNPSFAAGTFSWGYDITITDPTLYAFADVSGDLLQTAGQSSLAKTITAQDGDTYNIDFTKTGTSGYSGNTSVTLDSNDVTLTVAETLTVAPGGSNVSGVQNSFTEVPVPEPQTWAMLTLGFASLAFVGYRGRRTAVSIV